MFTTATAVLHSPSAHLRGKLSVLPAENKLSSNTQSIQMKLKELVVKQAISAPGVYLLALVTDNISSNPFHFSLQEFKNVKAGESLDLGPGGLVLYSNQNGLIPAYLHFRILVMSSQDATRDFSKLLHRLSRHEDMTLLAGEIHDLTELTPGNLKVFSQVSEKILLLASRILKNQKDEQLLQVIGSYDNAFDELGSTYGAVLLGNQQASLRLEVTVA